MTLKNHHGLALLLLALAFIRLTAHAESGAGGVITSVTLGSDCLAHVSTMSFGTSSALQPVNVNASTTLQVTCSMSTPYTIAMGPSVWGMTLPVGYNDNHAMRSSSAGVGGRPIYLPYNITQDSAGSVSWGSTVGTDTVGGTGTGTGGLTTMTVYGRLTANSGAVSSGRPTPMQADTYTDQVTITLQY